LANAEKEPGKDEQGPKWEDWQCRVLPAVAGLWWRSAPFGGR
jgi:hypothetical protein